MDAGDDAVLSARDRSRIGDAVRAAERTTGLQVAVAVGETADDARTSAERLFLNRGLADRPAVLVLVAPGRREVEVLTSAAAQERVTDAACESAVATMTARFACGDLAGGLVEGLQLLTTAAGAGVTDRGGSDLPDLID